MKRTKTQFPAWRMRGVPALLTCVGLAACAAGNEGTLSPVASQAPTPAAPGSYTLTAEEQALDCKKLTGRMQIRIIQIRDHHERPQASAAARTMQSAAAPLLKASTEGADPDARYARDRAMIEAYNAELKRRGCPAFDLDAELTPKPGPAAPLPATQAKK